MSRQVFMMLKRLQPCKRGSYLPGLLLKIWTQQPVSIFGTRQTSFDCVTKSELTESFLKVLLRNLSTNAAACINILLCVREPSAHEG